MTRSSKERFLTPHEEQADLAAALSVSKLYFKREDLHPLGSHKGRSIPVMIDRYFYEEEIKHFVITGTGNAALAALRHVKKLNLTMSDGEKLRLEIIVGRNIAPHKLARLEEEKADDSLITITHSDRPIQTLFIKTQDTTIRGLRQSTDDISLLGYSSLAEELIKIPDIKAVFVGTSSGTTAQALAEYFTENGNEIEIHIVQTSSCHPIVDSFETTPLTDERSIADAIVDKTALRKEKLSGLITSSGGYGWVAVNDRINEAMKITKKHTGLPISTNSALSVAGLMEAVYAGRAWKGAVVCLICGE